MINLYSYYRSPASYQIRIALALKGLKYKYHGIHLVKNGGEQNTEEYKALNPQATVPTLVDGKTVITQSGSILEYLEEKYPDPNLLPKRNADRAYVRQIAQMCMTDIQPLLTLRILNYLSGDLEVSQTQRQEWQIKWLTRGFDVLETMLSKNPDYKGVYCHGKSVTLADICLVAQVYEARRADMDISVWPTIESIEQNCLKLEAFQQASPETQPDTPEDQRYNFLKGLAGNE